MHLQQRFYHACGLLLVLFQCDFFRNNKSLVMVEAYNNGVGRTPPMGWNSWNHFRCNITEELIHSTIEAIASLGLHDLGYEYINLDDCWQQSRDPVTKQIVEDRIAFPSGMKALGDHIHERGFKYGLYSDSGTKTCQARPGSLGYEIVDADSYAAFGCDYLKYDNCYNPNNTKANLQQRYTAMRDALNSTGRPIFFSMCEWGIQSPATWATGIGNSWRTTGDIQKNWGSIMNILDQNNQFAKYAQPGGWNDPDMLEVGNGKLTWIEQRTHFTLWAIMKSPLLLGNDVTNVDQGTIDIIGNTEMIAINQDALGIQAQRITSESRDDGDDNGNDNNKNSLTEVWAGPLSGGDYVVVLFNRSSPNAETITVHWQDIGIHPKAKYMKLRDLWGKQDLTVTNGSFSAIVDPHDILALRLSPISSPDVEDHSMDMFL